MLDNIKFMLGLTDESKDAKISFYIKKLTGTILELTNRVELTPALEDFIENKVFSIVKAETPRPGAKPKPEGVKSISRGSTTITYEDNANTPTLKLTDEELEYILKRKKLRTF